MDGHAITMLGTGLIGDFYTNTLHGQRGRDRVRVVYSRSAERGAGVPRALGHPRVDDGPGGGDRTIPDTDVVVVALPNYLHEEAVGLVGAGRQGRPVHEAARAGPPTRPGGCSTTVEEAGVFGGYLEDLCYTPKTLKAIASVEGRRDRRRDLGPLARDASRARTPPGSGTAG